MTTDREREIICRQCGQPARIGRRGPRAAFCSIACQKRFGDGISQPPPCFRCGQPTRIGQGRIKRRFCSIECGQAQALTDRNAASEARRAAQPPQPCAWCSTPFRPKAKARRQRFCSKVCHDRGTDRLSNARRAGLSEVRVVVRREVYDRDGWRCHLCRRKVDRRLRYPDPRSASLDHLIPLADGGTHDPANLATAHLGCNQARSRGGTVQLRAIA